MPRNRWVLTRAERGKYLSSARWLAAAGAAIEIPEADLFEPRTLAIDQYGPEFNQIVFNQYGVRAGVVVGIRLLASQRGIMICDCHFSLLSDIGISLVSVSAGNYRLAPGLEFHRDEVLNHRLEEDFYLSVGKPVAGLLIATGATPLPEEYLHGAPVEMQLTLVDQFDKQYTAKMELITNRTVGGKLPLADPRSRSTSGSWSKLSGEDFCSPEDICNGTQHRVAEDLGGSATSCPNDGPR
jgi:hypothetical protein